jgi:hypothetical protein
MGAAGRKRLDATPGSADGCEKKGVAGRETRKVMKTKGSFKSVDVEGLNAATAGVSSVMGWRDHEER